MIQQVNILFVKRVQSLNLPKFLCLKATQEHLSFMINLSLKSFGKVIFEFIVMLTPRSGYGSAIPAEFLIFCAGSPQTKHDSLSPVFNCAKVEGVLVQKNGQP